MTRTSTLFPLGRRTLLKSAAAGAALAALPMRRLHAAAPLKLGVLLPRSGFLALIGQACQRGVDMGLPVLKDMGYDIEVMNADTESSPDVGRTQAEKLIREGAQMLMGTFDSATTMSVAQVAEQKGIPFVVNIASDPKITEQGYKYTFRVFPTSPQLGAGGMGLMKTLFAQTGTTPKTAVFMHVNDSFGMSMLAGVNALMPKLEMPFKIVETIAYDPRAKDLSIEVAKAKAAKADMHMVVTRLNDAILMVREMVKQQYETQGIISPGSPGMYERQFAKTLGKYADYCVTNIPWFDPRSDLNKELEPRFTKAFPDETYDINFGFTFEAVLVAADAYKRAGSANPQALTEALRKTSIAKRLLTGTAIAFDEKGQNNGNQVVAVQNRDGKPQVVLPDQFAVMKPVYPVPAWSKR